MTRLIVQNLLRASVCLSKPTWSVPLWCEVWKKTGNGVRWTDTSSSSDSAITVYG